MATMTPAGDEAARLVGRAGSGGRCAGQWTVGLAEEGTVDGQGVQLGRAEEARQVAQLREGPATDTRKKQRQAEKEGVEATLRLAA